CCCRRPASATWLTWPGGCCAGAPRDYSSTVHGTSRRCTGLGGHEGALLYGLAPLLLRQRCSVVETSMRRGLAYRQGVRHIAQQERGGLIFADRAAMLKLAPQSTNRGSLPLGRAITTLAIDCKRVTGRRAEQIRCCGRCTGVLELTHLGTEPAWRRTNGGYWLCRCVAVLRSQQ